MFTGLVEEVGRLVRLDRRGSAARAVILCELGRSEPLALGESVSVAGVCLTVARVVEGGFEADVSEETLAKTSLGALSIPARVNLERATKLGGRMGGHVVLGHVDGLGRVVEVVRSGDGQRATFETGTDLAPLIAVKGSIAVDGVSLTVNEVRDTAGGARFSVMLVPHTLAMTTLLDLRAGSVVNLEVDVFARYVDRQLGVLRRAAGGSGQDDAGSSDERLLEKLRGAGYT